MNTNDFSSLHRIIPAKFLIFNLILKFYLQVS